MSTQTVRADARDSNARALTRERERRLFLRWARFRDRRARDELAEGFLPLAYHLARRFRRQHDSLDDLVQVASVGLMNAIDRFDPERGLAFSSFAVPTIMGELKHYARDYDWTVHVPRGVQENVMRVRRATRRLSTELGRPPTVAEVADATELTAEQINQAASAAAAAFPASLEVPESDDDGVAEATREIPCEDVGYELVEHHDAIARALRASPSRDRVILRLRFFDELSQAEIGDRLGISQMQVSRLIGDLLGRLRSACDGTDSAHAPRLQALARSGVDRDRA